MHVVIFTHPAFFGSKSMPKYVKMLSEGLEGRGHTIEIATAKAFFSKLPSPVSLKKWLGYIDQFVLFPVKLKRQLKKLPSNTLFVFADQALGPWMPFIVKRPHVVHCHDFLAQRSALGEIPENRVGLTGKLYQAMIRRGYRKATNFISISKRTRCDLHLLLNKIPRSSEIVYNGLNQDFRSGDIKVARRELQNELKILLVEGFILHVGGNQFYKNRKGVIDIYSEWRQSSKGKIPLLMIGSPPTDELLGKKENSKFSSDIHFLVNVSDHFLQKAYQGATVLLYPSLEEGFGWPIAEAMASGCPVITVDKAPMNEVGGKNCFYLPALPQDKHAMDRWLKKSAKIVDQVCELPEDAREEFISSAMDNAKRFDPQTALEKIEGIYKEILRSYNSTS